MENLFVRYAAWKSSQRLAEEAKAIAVDAVSTREGDDDGDGDDREHWEVKDESHCRPYERDDDWCAHPVICGPTSRS